MDAIAGKEKSVKSQLAQHHSIQHAKLVNFRITDSEGSLFLHIPDANGNTNILYWIPTNRNGLLRATKNPAELVTVRDLWTCLDCFGLPLGRRDWTRTNDPHHVKVVL